VNPQGDVIWSNIYSHENQESPQSIIQLANGNLMITGSNSNSEGIAQLYLLKVGPTGNKIWDNSYSGGIGKAGSQSIELINGDIITCGYLNVDTMTQALVVRTNINGEIIWEKTFGEQLRSEFASSLKQNLD